MMRPRRANALLGLLDWEFAVGINLASVEAGGAPAQVGRRLARFAGVQLPPNAPERHHARGPARRASSAQQPSLTGGLEMSARPTTVADRPVAIVIGASGAVGSAPAPRLAADGHIVVVARRARAARNGRRDVADRTFVVASWSTTSGRIRRPSRRHACRHVLRTVAVNVAAPAELAAFLEAPTS